jgi:hypothetical protein
MIAGFKGLAMLSYTLTSYPGQETAQEVRPGLVGALTYAPRITDKSAGGVTSWISDTDFHVMCDITPSV